MKLLNFERREAKLSDDRDGLTADAPSHIYLQACGDCGDECADCLLDWGNIDCADVTWSSESINETDVEYVRLDLAIMSVLELLGIASGE